ncbi:hypothetical protein [Pelolinea submarina]|uniref:ABC-2 type transport system permease protein n=1 Tax=Pelolinea submarina TaxID=913107 RepID=A0A347ZWC7_9CHLR|nr:hypothetical protein [Pelolinea submarina]REG05350.1 hypothetical protein DFR64_2750 [Pelolinea submarina]BBB49608.1 hypothetical protein Pelsub_P2839 [Pelolinea submarina]
MKIRAYLKYQFHLYMLRWRWLLPIPVGLVLGYWAAKLLQAYLPWDSNAQANALEAFVWAFGKPEIVYYVISILYIYLISGLGLKRFSEQEVLLQLGSRSQWWLGKIIFIFMGTVGYTVLLMAGFFLPVLTQFPLSKEWSPAGQLNGGISLGYATLNGSPTQAFWSILLLLFVGWFAIGLLILIVDLLSQRAWPGYLGGIILIVCSNLGMIEGGPIGGEGISSFFMLQNHLEFTPLWAPTRVIPQVYSWIFWSVWILLCLVTSRIIYKRQNLYAIARREE